MQANPQDLVRLALQLGTQQTPLRPRQHGRHQVLIEIPLPLKDGPLDKELERLTVALPTKRVPIQFDYTWAISSGSKEMCSGSSEDGVVGLVQRGQGLGEPPWTAWGYVVALCDLAAETDYTITFTTRRAFKQLLLYKPELVVFAPSPFNRRL